MVYIHTALGFITQMGKKGAAARVIAVAYFKFMFSDVFCGFTIVFYTHKPWITAAGVY